MPEPLFQLRNITKQYGERRVLAIDSLDIEEGEIVAIVGPSGAGKSTLLRLLNFLEEPTGGRIYFAGTWFDNSAAPPVGLRRRITTVFQRPLLLSRSVRENVRYGLNLRGKRDDNDLVDQVLAEVGMSALMEQDARRLSGGEAQRVALARAMILQPDVLLLDEPTANLDPQNVALIEKIVRRLNDMQHTTMVLVTHNIFQARRLADRVAFLLNGELVEMEEAATFFGNPKDPRTQAFVAGDMIY